MIDQARRGLLDTGVLGPHHHPHTAFGHFVGHVGAHIVVEAAQNIGAAIDQGRIDAQPGEDAGELHRDIAAAHHADAFGQAFQVERLVGRDGVFDARHLLGHDRPPARGDQHLVGGDGLALANQFDGVGVQQPRLGVHQLGARLAQIGHISARQARDLGVLGHQKSGPVEGRLDLGPAIALGHLELVRELRGEHHELLGHAAAHHAGAADLVLLGDGYARPAQGRNPRRPHPARTRADDEQVVVIVSHGRAPVSAAANLAVGIRWVSRAL